MTDALLIRIARGLAFAGLAAIIVLSLIPSTARPHTGAGGGWEHLLAYALVALAFGLGYRTWGLQIVIGLALSAGSALLEVLQHLVPGRTPELEGFFTSSAGTWIGLLIAAVALARWRKDAAAAGEADGT